ncbi:MAG: hypothetical protein Q7J17_12940, partial [Candidatus Deferrimicrobium sp.]
MRRQTVQNLRLLLVYCTFLVTMIVGYSFLFRYLMLHLEGREFSLIASIYWTITVMTTLVTISGVVFLLIFLPFVLISMFVAPWLQQSLQYRPKTELPAPTRSFPSTPCCSWPAPVNNCSPWSSSSAAATNLGLLRKSGIDRAS